MATQVETSNQNTLPPNVEISTDRSRDSLHGRGILKTSGTVLPKGPQLASVKPPDACCRPCTKFRVAKEAGLPQLGSERLPLFDELTPPRIQRTFRTVYRITRNREDAEDAMQDACLKALMHFEDFDGRSAFATWFTRIAINCSLMILRKRKKARTVSLNSTKECEESQGFQEAQHPVSDPEERYLQRERECVVRDAVEELRPSLRIAVELTHFGERSIQETAKTLTVSLAATKARLFHARAALRKSRRLADFAARASKRIEAVKQP